MSVPLMIFAAGRGTRMRALTDDRPKPMVKVAGKPLIDHALDLAAEAEIGRVVVNLHYLPGVLEAHLSGRTRPAVVFAREAELLDTGGGLKAAMPLLDFAGPASTAVRTLNADAVWSGPNPFTTLDVGPEPAGARLLVVPKARAVGHLGAGDFFIDNDGRLTRRGAAATAPFVYTGLQIIDPGPVMEQAARIFSLNAVWDDLLAAGRLRGVVYPGWWCDVGQPESLPLAEDMLNG